VKKCQAIKANGGRCERIVSGSQDYCYAHDPQRKEERKRNAARGGKAKATGEISWVKSELRDLAAGVLSGEIDRGVGAVANQVFSTYLAAVRTELKVKEIQEHEDRLRELQRLAGLPK
jgi:hypothetical protein